MFNRSKLRDSTLLERCLVGVVLLALLPFASNGAAAAACREELQRLAADWRAISLPDTLKPSVLVRGRDGRTYSGGQINYMKTEIRLAHADCEAGRDQEALARIDIVRRVLRK